MGSAGILGLVVVGGCSSADSLSESVSSTAEAYRVEDPALACGTPTPVRGENMTTSGVNAVLQEWSDSIAAMPASATKTDLTNRLLTNVQGPSAAYPDVTERTNFLRGVRAPLPMSLPFGTQSSGYQVTGLATWLYDNGGNHGGVDFWRGSVTGSDDPSFDVLAVADGKVIGVYFDGPPGGGGNTIVIEHTGANGKKIYSFYMHLRNGATNDSNAVKNMDCHGIEACAWYKIAANKVPLANWWGTNADVIPVQPGQNVKRGQKIARAGSTMTVMDHIDSSGNATSAWGNNHLHIYIAAPRPAPDDKKVVEVDPFGDYQMQKDGCYVMDPTTQPDKPTYYSRLFAPFLPDFHDLGWGPFTAYPDYLNGMNYAPATLSFYDKSGFKVTGSYRYSTDPYFLQVGVASSALSDYMGFNKTWIPREMRVRINGSGAPIYDFTATPKQSGESTAVWSQLSQASLDSMYQAFIVSGGYNIGDFFPYQVAGTQYYAAVFTTSASASNWMTYGRSASQALSDIANIPAGLQLAQVVADTTWSPPKFSVLARPAAGCTPHKYVDQLATGYQSALDWETAHGYVLQKVQVYASGTKFNAVFAKASGTCTAQP
ncbi:hypothetical protein AKJ09_02382 [Labilithrix luteola]|uniref:Uncharacterized protein n=1 Tax=Labilithrix luteola TaxID=1391654 RepID=A0A0K1PQC2_9BACT|nr:hypothetical protein AKJ09_02382 [Labilithrix luteola]